MNTPSIMHARAAAPANTQGERIPVIDLTPGD